jgi:prevent-host-death family protein
MSFSGLTACDHLGDHIPESPKRRIAPLSRPLTSSREDGAARQTREVGIRELKHHASEVIKRIAEGERVVVTRRGMPVAVILSLDEALEFALGYAEEFVRARADALDHVEADE